MNEVPAHIILNRLFSAILSEAEKNEAFARKLIAALPNSVVVKFGNTKPRPRRAFDPANFHAINILRQHGEPVLRGKLEQIRSLEDLKAVARASGLVLTGEAAKPKASREGIINAIISAAKHYDAQRSSASA
ncbi:MAG TPA: hypothetical protein VNK52_17760 [Hyphomicrobiaceae bacterium]|nr:hypothetical protein [Hyphomicrobiaceae bacterium]